MKTHTNDFKNTIKQFGRELDSKITYGLTELGKEQLNSVTPHYESSLLKSVMKQLDIDSNVEIPLETVINYQFGVKVGNSYEYLDFGNYVVYNVEKQEDTRSWKITCYDKMLYAMKNYESLGITYPITVKNYLSTICTKIGLTLASDDFVNANKEIPSELYLDSEGNSLGYTYRDVLDEIAQVVAGIICINNDDEIEVRYPSNVGEYETVEGTFLHLDNVDDTDDFSYELKGNTVQNGTPTPDSPVDIQVATGRQTVNVIKKNFYKPFSYSRDTQQVLFTHNEDGTITAVGTASANCFSIQNSTVSSNGWYITLYPNTYILSGGINDAIRLQVINNSGTGLATDTGSGATFTITEKTLVYIRAQVISETVVDATFYPMIEVGDRKTTYEEYKELDYEIWLDNNMFDKNDYRNNSRIASNGGNYAENGCFTSRMIKVEPNTTYVKNSPTEDGYHRVAFYTGQTTDTFISKIDNSNTFTTPATCQYLRFCGYKTELDTAQLLLENQERRIIELCKIGDYKDKIYKQDGKWYLYKEIGKVVLDGTQSIAYSQQSNGVYLFNVDNALYSGLCISNRFIYNYANTNGSCYISASASRFGFCNTSITSNSSALTWLSNNNVIAYYQLETPTTTEITDINLINQLEAIRLQLGVNNITVDSNNLSSPLKLTYLSELETIDEEMLKNVNVNFGEKFGPVNSVVLSRSAESDNIYENDETSITQNGLTEIKIKDNQILNGNNRDEFLPDIFNKLNGLEYYVNDYVSTGIAYLELGDFYKVKVENNSYKCLMLNDELDVTQGLEEPIHAERMEDSETDYTKADKTDRKLRQAYIIVDKQSGEINSVVESIDTLEKKVDSQGNQIDALGTRITQTETNITARVTSVEGQLENGVNLVKTTSVIINDEGLTVATDTSNTTTTMTSDRFKVSSGGKELAYFGYDENIGSTKAQMDNLTVTNYFVAGYHRTEKYDEGLEHRTGVFYIGG